MTEVALQLDGVACGYRNRAVLADVNLSIRRGELFCLLGPNGVGKTTLFKTMLRLLPLQGGAIRIGGEDVAHWSAPRFAKTVAYVPQAHTPPFPFKVLDVVAMGRAAHLGPFAAPSRSDLAITRRSLETLGIDRLADRPYTEISGGERQLALIARALAQRPEVLVMDEPTANLDFGHQIRVLDHVKALTRNSNITVVMTSHDPNQALRYATQVATLGRNGACFVGAPTNAVTERYLLETYGVRTQMVSIAGSSGIVIPAPCGQGRAGVVRP
jgi:iron complex transport system ATP-binding protein